MRYIKDILLEKAILHVVDVHADGPILTSKGLSIDEDVEAFVRKHVVKSLNDDETMTCRFLSENVPVAQEVIQILQDPDQLLERTNNLTQHMFDITKNSDIPSGDMLFVQFIADDQRCFGILKLDYQLSFMHNISFKDEALCIDLISQEVGLPGMGQRLKKCVFFTKAPENQVEMIVLDKKQKIEGGDEDYFVDKYLQAVKVTDDTEKTRRFKKTVEKWTQKNLSEQIDVASEVRDLVNEKLLTEAQVSVDELSETIEQFIPDGGGQFKEAISEAGYSPGSQFQVDKQWVEKKMKSKQIKTDTGVVIRGEFDFFKDHQRFVIKKNGDGTIDYIIKGVRNVVEG